MAKKVARPAESWTYVLKDDRELRPEEQSHFVLRPLTQSERALSLDEVMRGFTSPDGVTTTVVYARRQAIETVITCLLSVENFPAGAPEPWPTSRADRLAYLNGLSVKWISELADEVFERSIVGDDLKNS